MVETRRQCNGSMLVLLIGPLKVCTSFDQFALTNSFPYRCVTWQEIEDIQEISLKMFPMNPQTIHK